MYPPPTTRSRAGAAVEAERRGRVPDRGPGSSPGSVAGREPMAAIACLKRSVAGARRPATPGSSRRSRSARGPARCPRPRLGDRGQSLGEAVDGRWVRRGASRCRRSAGTKVDARGLRLGRVVDQRRDAEKRLGRDAADVEALTAERAARLDEHRVKPEIGRAERGRRRRRDLPPARRGPPRGAASPITTGAGTFPILEEERRSGASRKPGGFGGRSAPPPCRR